MLTRVTCCNAPKQLAMVLLLVCHVKSKLKHKHYDTSKLQLRAVAIWLIQPNGWVNHTTSGQTATCNCNMDFILMGGSSVTCTCQATGMWSGSGPTCQSRLLPSICTQVGSHTLLPNCLHVLVRRSHLLYMQNEHICTKNKTMLIVSCCGVWFHSSTNCMFLPKLSSGCQSCNDCYNVILNFNWSMKTITWCILPIDWQLWTVALWLIQTMAKLIMLLEQDLDRLPPIVVVQASTWWEIIPALVKLQECGLVVHLAVKVLSCA